MAKKSKKIDQQAVVATQGKMCDEVYQAIFSLSPDAIAVHDGATLQLINPAGLKMLGATSEDEVIGKPILNFAHPEDHLVVKAHFARQLQGQDVPTLTTKLIRVDGSILDVEINSSRYHYQGAPASLIFIRDITERKRTEDALRESEAGLRQAQHYAQMGSWSLNMQTGQLSWSDEMYAIYGIDKATFTGALNDVIEKSVHPGDRAKVNEIKRMTIEQGNFWPMEHRIVWADGSTHIIRAEPAEITRDENGAVLFLRGTSQEITERKLAEMLLKQSENRLHQAAQLARLGVWEWNVTTDKLEVNDILLEIYGISSEEFAGKGTGYIAFTRADYRKTQLDYIASAFEQGITEADLMAGKIPTAKPLEICIVRPDGSECYVLGSAVGLVDEHGKRLRMLGTLQDITERKQIELALRKSESRLKQATQLARLGIWDWDAKTDHVEWSEEIFRIYGISPEEFTGKGSDYFEFTRADYREAQRENVAKAFAHGITEADLIAGKGVHPDPNELCIVRPDGSECYTMGDAVCIVDENGKPLHMLGVTQDITERKETEERLRESEERFRSLSDASFEGIMIHDQGVIQDANQVFAHLLGYEKPEDLIGKNGLDLIPFTPESLKKLKTNMRTGSTEPVEINIIQPDDTILPLETQGRDFIFKGRKMRVVAVRNISKRKQAEYTQARLTAILEATPDFVAIADPGQRLMYLNRAGRRMVGIGENENINNLKIGDLNPEWATPIIKRGLAKAVQDGIWSGETARLTRDGREIPTAQVIIAHKGHDGTLEYLSTICRDISESKKAEERIRRQLDHLTALSEIDRAITSSVDLNQSLETLLKHVVRQLDVDAADALLFDQDKNVLEYIAGSGFRSQNLEGFAMSIGTGYASLVIEGRQIVEVPDLLAEPEHFVRKNLFAADDFVSYYGVPLVAKDQVKGVLEVFHRTPLHPDQEWFDFLNSLAEQAAIAVENALLFNDLHHSKLKLEQAYDTTLDGWSRALDLRDKETEGHTRRVTELTIKMARKMGFSEEELKQIKRGGLLHDIGKMGIPDSILLKPSPLNEGEWMIMRKHTTYAYEMLSPIEYLKPALDIPYCHHEHWDGSGYPRGLKGEQIPLVARIFSVVDVWDALRSDRPYRKAWEKEKVMEYIQALSGKQFDPAVVDVFMKMINDEQ